MDAIIMAAGKGTRMGDLTLNMPKSLLEINGQPILDRTIKSLPAEINRVLLVISHHGEKIRDYVLQNWPGRCLCVEQTKMGGTAGAVWSVRELISSFPVLVLNGDDVYQPEGLKRMVSEKLAMGVSKSQPGNNFLVVDNNSEGFFTGFHNPSEDEKSAGFLIAAGAYVLNKSFFETEPVKIKNEEYGLPQTLSVLSKTEPVRCVDVGPWISINTPDDLEKARRF